MKKLFLSLILLFSISSVFAQSSTKQNQLEIKQVLQAFMKCLMKKDSVQFYSLFHTDPVLWIGISKPKTYEDELKKNNQAKDYFSANYKSFYRHFYDKEIEEKFYNIHIIEDGSIASVTFDYSFWEKGVKLNWGKESWALIKTQGKWKITAVIFSSEEEAILPENNVRKCK